MLGFQLNDGGRPQGTPVFNDCVVRAVAIAARLPYDVVYNTLEGFGLLTGTGVNVGSRVFKDWLTHLGFVRISSITEMRFIPHGRVIAFTPGHYTAIIDGVINDVRDESNDIVMHYWVYGTRFVAVNRDGVQLSSGSLNAQQAQNMVSKYTDMYRKTAFIKAI